MSVLSRYGMTDTDFILLTRMTKEEFAGKIRGMNVIKALEFRKSIQMAMTSYRRNHPNDQWQMERGLVICATIEKWCRDVYFRFEMKKVQREHPAWPRTTVKIEVKRAWEDLVRRSSF